MKTLYVDLENGYKSLGSKEDIKNMFGYDMLSFQTFSDFRNFVGKVWTMKKVQKTITIDGIEVNQVSEEFVAKEGTSVECLVIDTGSEMAKKYVRELKGTADTLKLQQWGKLKDVMDKFFSSINNIPCNLVINCHSKGEIDNENGVIRMMPYLEGSTKVDVGKWFDFVLYTKVVKNKGNREYVWITARDEHFCHAKDRSQLLDDQIPQDYGLLKEAANKRGWDSFKALIIGEPGSGKTLSLKTLNKKEK